MRTEKESIPDLKRKKENLLYTSYGVGLLGGVAGTILAISKNKKFWTCVGYWIIGSIAIGVPARIIIHNRITKINQAITQKEETAKIAEQAKEVEKGK